MKTCWYVYSFFCAAFIGMFVYWNLMGYAAYMGGMLVLFCAEGIAQTIKEKS